MDIPAPKDNAKYVKLTDELRTWHGELIQGRLADNPVKALEYLEKMRLDANLLFSFWNNYIDLLVDLKEDVAEKNQGLYESNLALKMSQNASKIDADYKCKKDNAKISKVESYIQQVKNEYERYNGICMFLQSRLKEFQSERFMG